MTDYTLTNHIHAITKDLFKLKELSYNNFTFLTKKLYEFQIENNVNIFNITNLNDETIQLNLSKNKLESENNNYEFLANIYSNYIFFKNVKDLTKRTTQIKKISPIYIEKIEDVYILSKLRNLLNIITLLNLIKKQFKDKKQEDFKRYNFFQQLNNININLINILGLKSLYDMQDVINDFNMNIYTYDYFELNFKELSETLTEDTYQHVYNLIYLFN